MIKKFLFITSKKEKLKSLTLTECLPWLALIGWRKICWFLLAVMDRSSNGKFLSIRLNAAFTSWLIFLSISMIFDKSKLQKSSFWAHRPITSLIQFALGLVFTCLHSRDINQKPKFPNPIHFGLLTIKPPTHYVGWTFIYGSSLNKFLGSLHFCYFYIAQDLSRLQQANFGRSVLIARHIVHPFRAI